MSWSTCYSGSNNINFNFPPIMADGRNFATWQPDAVVNERIQVKEGIQSNWGYRQYLQRNGLQVINYNSTEACYTLGLDPHVKTDRTPSDNDLEETPIAPISKIDTSELKTISINLEEPVEKIDYKKLQLPKLKSIVVEKGLATSSDASKLKKAELLKLLGIE